MLSSAAQEARDAFRRLVESNPDDLPLDEAALWIAAESNPHLDVVGCMAEMDRIAAAAKAWVGDATPADSALLISRFHSFFFGELGFRGNTDAYDDVRNSFLDQVLKTRTGIPITLSLVYQEVARRLYWPVAGVGFPGHFLVRWQLAHESVVVDVYNGVTLSLADVESLLARTTRGRVEFTEDLLAPVSVRAILVRILNNLRGAWIRDADYVSAISACDRILILAPEVGQVVRDRGLLWLKLECFCPAVADLRKYLEANPQAPDLARIQSRLASAEEQEQQIS